MCFNAVLPGGKTTSVRILSTVDNILIGECLGLDPEEKASPNGPPLPPIALFQGLPKGAKMDLIGRQAAEGGISVVVPFESEYSTAKQGKDSKEKIKRWERIIKEARQQSGSAIETKILPTCTFDALLQYWKSLKNKYPSPLGIMLHQEALDKGTLHGYLDTRPDFVAMAVGPEGGFSPGEVSRFLAAGFRPMVLGSTILRTETAALYGAAAIRITLLESEAWTSCQKESCSSKSPST
jgi:16S rRNA (uracil1498-N3)-methyltransferase